MRKRKLKPRPKWDGKIRYCGQWWSSKEIREICLDHMLGFEAYLKKNHDAPGYWKSDPSYFWAKKRKTLRR